MAAQLFGRHVAHCSNGLSWVCINGFLWTGRQRLRKPEVHDFRQLAGVTSHKKDVFWFQRQAGPDPIRFQLRLLLGTQSFPQAFTNF
jgi:hypothetical protein